MAHAKTGSNPNDFILPDLGEGVHEAELIKWRVQVGQKVNEHDILAEMETDKALVEVPSPRTGVIAALHGKPGEILKVGNALVSYEGGAGAGPAASAGSNGKHRAPEVADVPEPEERREDDGTVVGKMSGELGGVSAGPGKVLATPAVRRLARDLGVDLAGVTGTGIAGRVTEKDVREAAGGGGGGGGAGRGSRAGQGGRSAVARAAQPAPLGGGDVAPMEPEEPHSSVVTQPVRIPTLDLHQGPRPGAHRAAPAPSGRAAPSIPPGEATARIPFRGVRRTIANRLRESVNQAVHFNVMDEADVSVLDGLRKRLAAASGEKVSFLPFVCAAVCRVLSEERFRALNSTVDDKAEEIVRYRAVHLGIATDTENGLMVPVIRDADALGVLEIGRHITGLAESARSRSIPREQLMGSTFTISNVGSHAGRFATPIINYPEVGILAVGRARPSPVVRGGGIFVGNLLPLSLACDHRVVDGATAALALAEIVRLLQTEAESLLGPARG